MTFRRRGLGLALVVTFLGAWLAWAQTPAGGSRPATPGAGTATAIATVGGRSISREELRAQETQAMRDYRARLGQEVPKEVQPVIRRQLLENLIRRELLALESTRRGVAVTEAEAEARLRKEPFFNPDGKFDSQRFDAVRLGQPENYRRALDQMRQQLGAVKLSEMVEREHAPPAAELRAAVERALSRASVQFLALRASEFNGAYREPREIEVVAAYRANARSYTRPAEATLTVLMVDQPPLAEGVAPDGPEGQRWRASIRARADSALAAARGGSTFEDLAEVCGSVRREVKVNADNFPGYWQGDARDRAAVFAARGPGLLPAPVAARGGWMVVRLEGLRPEGVAPLADVARQVRGTLRSEARLHGEDGILRERYEKKRSGLATTAWKLRYAVFDTAAVPIGEPSAAEIDRWYRAHQADFSLFDPGSGSIRVRPLAEVRPSVITRLKSERRRDAVRIAASQVSAAWGRGQRDRGLERSAAAVRDVGPLIPGAAVDSTAAGKALTQELAGQPWSPRTATFASGGSVIAYHVIESVSGFVPPFEQMRADLSAERAAELARAEEEGARKLYNEDPERFSQRNVIHYGLLVIEPPDPLAVPLNRAEVERYYREHLDRYSAPELVRVRQILVAPERPGAEADAAARAKAAALLERARGGEDFAELARGNSDDPATRDQGGDLGEFGRGTMSAAFEEVAFALQPDQLSEVFRTDAGYHLLRCVSHLPLYAHELRYVHANVGFDLAMERADEIAIRRADSLSAALRGAPAARALAEKMRGAYDARTHVIGDRRGGADLVSFAVRLENTPPGKVVPGRASSRSTGHFVAWVDSVVPARALEWNEARPTAIAAYRMGAVQRAVDAKRAEIDSLVAGGWSVDSVAALFGGWERVDDLTPGTGLLALGGSEVVDSLVFGTPRRPAALREGEASPWVTLPGGLARVRFDHLRRPEPSAMAAQVENEGRIQLERRLIDYFDGLKKRHAIRILDSELRDTPLPPPPTSRLR